MAFAKRVFMIQNRVKIPKQIKLNTKLAERDGEEGAKQRERGREREETEMARNCRKEAGGRGRQGLGQQRDNCGRSFRLLSFGRVAETRLTFPLGGWEVGVERGVAFRKSQTTRDLGKLENGGWHEVWGGEGRRVKRRAAGHKC